MDQAIQSIRHVFSSLKQAELFADQTRIITINMLGLYFVWEEKKIYNKLKCVFFFLHFAILSQIDLLKPHHKIYLFKTLNNLKKKSLVSKLGVRLHRIILMRPPVVQLQWLPTHLTTPFAAALPRPKFEVALTFW